MKYGQPVDVITKIMTSVKTADDVFNFFQNLKNWESGGIITSVSKVENDMWICHTPAGKAKIKCFPDSHFQY